MTLVTAAEFIALERVCANDAGNAKARMRLLQGFFALGQPDALPGSSRPLAKANRSWRIAVLTPYYKESLALLERCHRSVAAQTVRCDHIVAADGHPREELDTWPLRHLKLPAASADSGDTPRRIAGELADASGYDAVLYLDADNWYRPRHAESLLACHLATGAPLCHSGRTLHRPGGSLLPLIQRGDNVDHVDTSCLFIARPAFDLLPLWGTWPRELSPLDDRMLWRTARARGHRHRFTGALTACYEATHAGIYRAIGETPPQDMRPDTDLGRIVAWHARLPALERLELDRRYGFSVSAFVAELDVASRS